MSKSKLEETLNCLKEQKYIIEVYGLGYVGFPLAVKLATSGIKVIGIDTNKNRINGLIENSLLSSEINLKQEFVQTRNNGTLKLKSRPEKNQMPKIGIICVPTPIPDGKIKSDIYVRAAVESFLNTAKSGDVIILESSIEVGTTENMIKLIQENGFKVGEDFGVCFCPERIDPGGRMGLEDISRAIYCSDDTSFDIAKYIYNYVNDSDLIRVDSPRIAEVVKSFENAFRLVNISLVNELAILCDKIGINVKQVIDVASTKPFGFMPHYPGAGAGGHCIPKDPRFLSESAKKFKLNFTTIENALNINAYMPQYIAKTIEKSLEQKNLPKSIIVCGLSYKSNVEDMRDSPSFKLITNLKNKGFEVYGYDPFFDEESIEKYLLENNLKELNFTNLKSLKDLENISCLCIVQHHDKLEQKILNIYEKSLIPLIYDCQNKLQKNPKSKSTLEFLGE